MLPGSPRIRTRNFALAARRKACSTKSRWASAFVILRDSTTRSKASAANSGETEWACSAMDWYGSGNLGGSAGSKEALREKEHVNMWVTQIWLTPDFHPPLNDVVHLPHE